MDEFYAAQQTAGRSCAITNARIAVAYAELVPASEDPVVLLTKLARRADKVLAEDRDRVVATFSTPQAEPCLPVLLKLDGPTAAAAVAAVVAAVGPMSAKRLGVLEAIKSHAKGPKAGMALLHQLVLVCKAALEPYWKDLWPAVLDAVGSTDRAVAATALDA